MNDYIDEQKEWEEFIEWWDSLASPFPECSQLAAWQSWQFRAYIDNRNKRD